ncbi:hypothetical protein MKW92_032824 [Papaver armeniacum]|nr:hypothetical protein MKW92_032824 [Papaver armeniacum]
MSGENKKNIQERTVSNDEHEATEVAALTQKEDNPLESSSTTERWITHYSSSQKILLVGEGDFSFSVCLAKAFGSAANMVATSLDSAETLWRRLPSSETNIDDLLDLGCLILHEVDVHDMASSYAELENMKFDRIIFNFPHAGHFRKLREEDEDLILMHKTLLLGFFMSSSKMLRENGEVHVALRDDHPYNTWGAEKLAKRAGLRLIEKVDFQQAAYAGYTNRRGSSIKCQDSFGLGYCPKTFKFSCKLR